MHLLCACTCSVQVEMAPGWDNGGALLVVAHCLNDPSKQCNSDSDCLGSSCSGSDPAEASTGVCESHDELQVSPPVCMSMSLSLVPRAMTSCRSPLSPLSPVSCLLSLHVCVLMSLPLSPEPELNRGRAGEQHGGAVKCYYKEHFAANATGDYAVRCFTAKDPHGDRRYSSVRYSSVPPVPSSHPSSLCVALPPATYVGQGHEAHTGRMGRADQATALAHG